MLLRATPLIIASSSIGLFAVVAGDDVSSAVLENFNCSSTQTIKFWKGLYWTDYKPEVHGDVRFRGDSEVQYLQFYTPEPIESSGDALYVRFHSDLKAKNGTRRFQLRYHLFTPGLISLFISFNSLIPRRCGSIWKYIVLNTFLWISRTLSAKSPSATT